MQASPGRSLKFLVLDHLKPVNDRHGPRSGDAVLRAFAAVVRRRLRASDEFDHAGGQAAGLLLPTTGAAAACAALPLA